MSVRAQARERRVIRRLEARGMKGLGQALVQLRGTQIEGKWELGPLYAVGAEGAVFLCHDVWDANQPMRVAKVALLPYHKPFSLSFDEVKSRRDRLREEAGYLQHSASSYMPQFHGLYHFPNPLLDPGRGGEFVEPEPVLVMERLPGFDLDYWLARVHRSSVPRMIVRRNADHVAVVVLRGLWDLHERGYFYCDLRPGNIRIRGRSEHRVRLLDAGSLVRRDDTAHGFPHVPAYLPPELFERSVTDGPETLVPSLEVQAVMAGRTLFEVATGRVPVPGQPVDYKLLRSETVSADIAELIGGLCGGSFPDVFHALRTLAKQTQRGKTTRPPKNSKKPPRPAAEPAPLSEPLSQPIIAVVEPVASTPPRDLESALAAARAQVVAAKKPISHPVVVPVLQPEAAPAAATAVAPAEAPEGAAQPAAPAAAPAAPAPAPPPPAPRPVPLKASAELARAMVADDILPESRPKPRTWWGRLLAKFGF
jgi:serine/threonine protein kinase